MDDERVSYDGFARAALAVAALLRERGLRKGDRVALVMRNLPEWPVVFMGALLAGAIAVPLNAWWTGTELAYGILDSGARFVFADAERLARLTDLPPSVAQIFVTRAANPPRRRDGAGRCDRRAGAIGSGLPRTADAGCRAVAGRRCHDLLYLRHHRRAQGRAGHAPFADHQHFRRAFFRRRAMRCAVASAATPAPAKQRVTLLAVPFFHVIGSLSVLLPNMAAGGKLVLMRKFDAEEALALIARERVTVTGGVPAVALALLEQADGHDLSSLELVTFGGAPCPASLAARHRARWAPCRGRAGA